MKDQTGGLPELEQGKKYGISPRRMTGYALPVFDLDMGMECLSMTHVGHAPPAEIMTDELIYYGNAGKWSWLRGLLDDDARQVAERMEFFICKSVSDPTGPWRITCIERSAEDDDMEITLTKKH